ncbi:hypothetical protein ACU686_16195 [Yinghuangia aomiensis]
MEAIPVRWRVADPKNHATGVIDEVTLRSGVGALEEGIQLGVEALEQVLVEKVLDDYGAVLLQRSRMIWSTSELLTRSSFGICMGFPILSGGVTRRSSAARDPP